MNSQRTQGKNYSKTYSKTHSKWIEGKKHIWDVYDLWEKSQLLPVFEIDPKSIIDLDCDGWFGGQAPTAGEVLDHMKRILSVSLDYPVILNCDDTIMDGAHRVCKAI